jgi:thioredoxin reductase (NADPH)
MSGERLYDVLVLGGVPAGMTAALYAKRANLRVALLETNVTGGLVNRRTRWKTSRRILKSTA